MITKTEKKEVLLSEVFNSINYEDFKNKEFFSFYFDYIKNKYEKSGDVKVFNTFSIEDCKNKIYQIYINKKREGTL